MSCPHSQFRKGQRILVIMSSGKKMIDKFKESKSGVIITESIGRIRMSDIRSTVIYRGNTNEQN